MITAPISEAIHMLERTHRRTKRQACVEVASPATPRPPLSLPLLPLLPLLPTLPVVGAGVGAAVAGAVILPGGA